MIVVYFVKFANDREPQRIAVKEWAEFVSVYLLQMQMQRGHIEWMIRE